MPIKVYVCKPERIKSLSEVVDILHRMDIYKKEYVSGHSEIGVLLMQNTHLGASYEIVSKEEADYGINNPRKCEWGVKFYPRSYFENLKKRLSSKR